MLGYVCVCVLIRVFVVCKRMLSGKIYLPLLHVLQLLCCVAEHRNKTPQYAEATSHTSDI